MTTKMHARFYEMVAEDARAVTAEWIEVGLDEAWDMLAMTREAERNGEPLPEPAETAKDRLRSYMRRADLELAWSEMLTKIQSLLSQERRNRMTSTQ